MDKFKGLLSDIKFRGVFANDAMPLSPKKGIYILNLENVGEDGSHWVLLWIQGEPLRPRSRIASDPNSSIGLRTIGKASKKGDKKKNLYYDSYGIVPTKRISKLAKLSNEQPFQGVQMQSCAYFAMYIAQNIMNGLKPTGDLVPFDAMHNEDVLKNYFF